MLKEYQKELDKILSEKSAEKKSDIIKKHEKMIAIIQHERLIHLLVTIFVGIVMTMSFLITIVTEKAYLLFLDIPLVLLFVGYLFHYRYLENTTQNWYALTQKITDLYESSNKP